MNLPAEQKTPRYVTCRCQHCDGHIEFDANEFAEENSIVPCPHCGLETKIFIPVIQTEKVPTELPSSVASPNAVRREGFFCGASEIQQERVGDGRLVTSAPDLTKDQIKSVGERPNDDMAVKLYQEGEQNMALSLDDARRYIADPRFKLMDPETGLRFTPATLESFIQKKLHKKKIESSKVEQGQQKKEYAPTTGQPMSQQDIRPATEKQLAYLNLFGFFSDRPLTIAEASALIEQFSEDPERQKIRDDNYVKKKLLEYEELNKNRAYYVRKDIEDAKRELEKAENDDISDAKMCVEDMRNARLDFWADTFEIPVNMQYGVYEQKAGFYFAHGYRFKVPTPEQIQIILDVLDADSATWDKDMPEYFYQKLENNFPQLLRKNIDLEALEVEREDSKEFLENLRRVDQESIIKISALRSSSSPPARPAVAARPQYPDDNGKGSVL